MAARGGFRIEGAVAVVTGAASGIGQRLARRLADRGCHLALVDIDEPALSATERDLRRPSIEISIHRVDVGDRAQVLALPGSVIEAHGRTTLLVNNAGVSLGGRFSQLALADIERLIDINLMGVIRMTHAFMPVLRRASAAHIVNLSSLFGIIAPPGQTAYAAAKFGVRGFSEALWHELRGTSMGLTVVHPGGFATNIANSMIMSKAMSDDEVAKARKLHAKLLTGDPDQAAAEIVAAIERRRRRLVIGADARRAVTMQRLFPVNYWAVAELMSGKRFRSEREPGWRVAAEERVGA